MAKGKTTDVDALVDQALRAVDDDELDTAESILDDCKGSVGENHPRVLHLAGMLAWAQGDLERANGFLMQAADGAPDRADIQLDCAECLFTGEELDEAEAQVRAALALPSLTKPQGDDARLLLAQIRLAGDDPDEALEVLAEIDPQLHGHPAFLSTRGSANMHAGKLDEAIADLGAAVELDPEDADLHYQLAIVLGTAGKHDEATAQMQKVRELDAAEDGPSEEPSFAEAQELRSRLEDVFEQLPDPLLKLVAHAPITVQTRASEEQVAAGVDPRNVIAFLGTRKRGNDDAELTGIVVMRDLLPAEDEADEEGDDAVETELFYGLMDELQSFFDRNDLVMAEA
ncbi:MAG: tetratricopeptide repeat protein [Deltaproteobacteria bacterium]|nr:tetratricopeptide repeat protein [Deltaproteobacteria bacterium]MBK8234453.1 tetratricopeptide repeat protein [Deltaproteobacteria bacterium]MBK8715186.1 tetratricopeptide repeat protein [Deltaproteobacteria bacterium]MBP7285108.1 tetratricopeptide repeat protein [Nannocystaceae bacterium]